jgi:hypothetical protein
MKIDTIKKLIRENISKLLSEEVNYFKDKTNVPDYDKVFNKQNDELPKEYKNWEAKIDYMTMEEYFEECAEFQNSTFEQQINLLWQPKVDNIATKMKGGVKYDMPYLDYVHKRQEGRHRVAAATELGQKKIPVLLLYKSQKTISQESTDLTNMLGEWDDLVKEHGSYYCVFEGTDWEARIELLRHAVEGLDSYYLDHLLDIKIGTYNYKSIEEYLKYEKNYDYGYINHHGKYKNFNEFLKAFAIMKNNQYMIDDAVIVESDRLLLKILDDINTDFTSYSSCKEMLKGVRNKNYYVKAYSLQDEYTDSEMYSKYTKEARKLFNEA